MYLPFCRPINEKKKYLQPPNGWGWYVLQLPVINILSYPRIEIARGGKSYTVDTIAELRSSSPGTDFFFITGVDSFLEIETWKEWEHLLSLCAFVVLSRPGYHFSDLLKIGFMKSAENKLLALDRGDIQHAKIRADRFTFYLESISHYDISSTMIRKRLRRGGSVKYLLPDPVENYIINNKIYV